MAWANGAEKAKGIGFRVSAAGVQIVVVVDLKVGDTRVVGRIAAAAPGVDLQEHPMMGVGEVVVDQYVLRLELLALAGFDVLVVVQESVVVDGIV